MLWRNTTRWMLSSTRPVWTACIRPPVYLNVRPGYQRRIRVASAGEIRSKGACLGFIAAGRRTVPSGDYGTGVGIGRIAEGAERRRTRRDLARLAGRESSAAVRRP